MLAALLDALQRAGDDGGLAGLEHEGVPIVRILQVRDVAFAGDGPVDHLEVLGEIPGALTGRGVRLGRVGDLERDLLAVSGHLQRVLHVVAVAGLFAGGHVVLLDVDRRGHVRGAGPHDVGLELLVVEDLGELVLDAFGHLQALALDVRAPAVLMRIVRGHERAVRLGRLDGDLAVLVGRGGEQFAAELRAVEAVAGELVALGGEHLAVPVQVAGRVHGPLARVLVELGVQRIHDLPLADLRVGAVGRDDGAVELVEEGAVLVHASAVDAFAADLDGHVLGRVDGLERVGHLVGLHGRVVGDLDGLVPDRVPILDLDDLVRHDDLVGLAEEVLVDGRIVERIMLAVGRILGEVLRLGVALDGDALLRDPRVHGLRVHVCDAVLDLDVELSGHVLAGLVEHLDLGFVDGDVLVIEIVGDAGLPHAVRVVGLLQVEGDQIVAGIAQQHGLPIDADRRVALLLGLVVLLGGVVDRRQVVDDVRRGDHVVQRERPLVGHFAVDGSVLRDGAFETDLHLRVRAGLPMFGHVLVRVCDGELVRRGVPGDRVVAFDAHLRVAGGQLSAGGEVGDLKGLRVGFEVLVVHVGVLDGHDPVSEVGGQFRLRGETVFDLLARIHDLVVGVVVRAALAAFGDDLLLDRWDVAADVRFVGRLGLVVDLLGTRVGQLGAVGVLAERELVARGLPEVLADLGRALAVGEVHHAGQEQADLLRILQTGLRGTVFRLRGRGDLGALDGDVELVGHVTALVRDVRDGGCRVGRGVGLVHADLRLVGREIPDVVGLGVIVGQLDVGDLDEIGRDDAVDHGRDLVAVEELLGVRSGLVRLVRIDHGLPGAVIAELDPALVRVRAPLPDGRLVAGHGLLVPFLPIAVGELDLLAGLEHALGERALDGHAHLAVRRLVVGRVEQRLFRGDPHPAILLVHVEQAVRVLAVDGDGHGRGIQVDVPRALGEIIAQFVGAHLPGEVLRQQAVDGHAEIVLLDERVRVRVDLVAPRRVLGRGGLALVGAPYLVGLRVAHVDRRLVGRLGFVVPGFGGLVGQFLLVGRGLGVRNLLDDAADVQFDLAVLGAERGLREERLLRGRGGRVLRGVDRDVELVGHVRTIHIHLDLVLVVPVDPLGRSGPIIGDRVGGERVEQVRGDTAVDHGADRVAGHERAVVAALVVRMLRILGRQGAVGVQHPHLVGLRSDLADLFAVAGLAVALVRIAVFVAGPAGLAVVRDGVVRAGRGRGLGHVQRVLSGDRVQHVRLDDAFARMGIVHRDVGLDGVAVLVGHGDLRIVVLVGAADQDLLAGHVDRVVQPEMLGRVRLGGDMRRIQAAGSDLLGLGGDLLARHVGELLRRRRRDRLPGFLRVLSAHMAGRGLHMALLADGHIIVVEAGRPCLPRLVHVPIAERDAFGRVVVLGELLGRGTGRAVQTGPMQRDGARHVLGDRAAATAGGDRVGNVIGRTGLGEQATRLRADGQIVVDRRLVLVEDDGDDRARGLAHLTSGKTVDGSLSIAESIGSLVIGSLIGISVVRNAGRIVCGLPFCGVEGAVGARVPVAVRAGRVHEAHGHEAAGRILVARSLRTGHAFGVRVVHGLVDGAVGLAAVHRLHADGSHGGFHILAGRGAEGVLVHPCDLAGAAGGAVARARAVTGAAATVGGERADDRGRQRGRGDQAGYRGLAPFLVLVGTQCSVSFQRFCLQNVPPCGRDGTAGTHVPCAVPLTGTGPSNPFHARTPR